MFVGGDLVRAIFRIVGTQQTIFLQEENEKKYIKPLAKRNCYLLLAPKTDEKKTKTVNLLLEMIWQKNLS